MACFLILLSLVVLVVNAKVKYNSQLVPPFNIQLADTTGDGIAEFYLFDKNKLYVTTTEFTVHGLAYLKLPVATSRVISGYFTGGTKAILCAQEPSLHRLDCYVMNPSNNELLWWWYQPDFIGSSDAVVGDFDGDGYDDILVYIPHAGTFQMFTWNSTTSFFQVMADWNLGDLASFTLKNFQIRAGNFGAPNSMTDLLFYNPRNGQALVFFSYYDLSTRQYKLWWSFTTRTGWGAPTLECMVADLNGDGFEDAILHDTVAGSYYTYNSTVAWDAPSQTMPYLATDLGDIHQGANSTAFFAKLKNIPSEDGGKSNIRDDSIVYSYDWQLWVRSDARYNGAKQSYCWSYTQYPFIRRERGLHWKGDGDAIITEHELGGYDPNNDGASDGILLSYGASPFLKDVFVQADYMAGPPGNSWTYAMDPSAVSLAVSSMARKQINLHIFIGNEVPYQANLGTPWFSWIRDFDPIKNENLPSTRLPFFHYCLFAEQYDGSDSTGISRAIVASDFIVTIANKGTAAEQTGTFLHELGHNLGLRHGSVDDTNNKPNHISIMNYNYQFSGVYKDNSYQFLFSDMDCDNLDESKLDETTGVTCDIGSNTYQSYIYSANNWDVVGTAFDWNQDATKQTNVSVDLNKDGLRSTLIGGVNEYDIMRFNGGSIGSTNTTTSTTKRNEKQEVKLWEPSRTAIPTHHHHHSNSTVAFSSSLLLPPHNGSQYLDSTLRHPSELFTKPSLAFVTGPSFSYQSARRNEKRGERGRVNTSPFPSTSPAPSRPHPHTRLNVTFVNSAVNLNIHF